jgi:hypothetical protein
MRRAVSRLAFLLAILLPFNLQAQKATKSASTITVHVKAYKRADGTVVKAHDRTAPGSTSLTKIKTGTWPSLRFSVAA